MVFSIILQSMYIFKQPRIGGVVKAHQDSTFIHTAPDTTTGFWIALEDCTKDNGSEHTHTHRNTQKHTHT